MKALIKQNVALAPLTTFRIGGPARYFIEAATEEAIAGSIQFAKDRQLPVFVLGGGSNLLVGDSGFPGLVIKVAIAGIERERDGERTILRAGAGEDWDRFVASCVEDDLAGVECLSGIPGLVGGTPVQNVGAYGQDVSEVLLSVRAYDRKADSIVNLSREACQFSYRSSIFNSSAPNSYIVLEVTYTLTNHGAPAIRYPDVQREFQGKPEGVKLSEVREAVRRIRARKAMLLVEGDPDCRSAGSFFKNPLLTGREFLDLQSRLNGVGAPHYDAGPGRVKTSAAWLIEHSGFSRGYSTGAAGISTKHTLAIVNKGGATAEDILRLAREIQARVYGQFGIQLVPEPVLVGLEWDDSGFVRTSDKN